MHRIHQAFSQDCNKLIQNFVKSPNPNFEFFCQEWKRMHFANVYSPLCNAGEIAQLTIEMLLVAKKIVVSDKPHMERLAALYLIYAIYFKQPTEEFVKIRVTLEEWRAFRNFWEWMLSQEGTMQARMIFCKLYTAQAFRIVFTELQYGFEKFYTDRHESSGTDSNTSDLLQKDLKDIVKSDGLLPALAILQDGYNEMKEIMSANDKNQCLLPVDVTTNLKSGFENIERILNSGNNADNEDNKSEAGSSCESIRARRVNLKKKAFAKNTQTQNSPETAEEFHISVEGDFIQITRGITTSLNSQRSSYIFQDDLPQEGLNELKPERKANVTVEIKSESLNKSSDSLDSLSEN